MQPNRRMDFTGHWLTVAGCKVEKILHTIYICVRGYIYTHKYIHSRAPACDLLGCIRHLILILRCELKFNLVAPVLLALYVSAVMVVIDKKKILVYFVADFYNSSPLSLLLPVSGRLPA